FYSFFERTSPIRQFCISLVLLSLLAACSLPGATEMKKGCQPSKIQKSDNGFTEVQADMKSDGEIWALLFFETAHVNEDEKIVWRITGDVDEFQAQAQNEEGTIIQPTWLEYHGGSNWQRPGQEWGTGFTFPTAGCWRITVTRGKTTGTISLDVLSLYP
ncbi:MAG TPA: hypothetical protein VK909_05715, partial [Anaerolineales bacterium]|nr:hypothetical protein [Anaerolineales bacterium]